MVSVDTCEPFFAYMRQSIELDSNTMQLIASNTNKTSFRQKEIIVSEGGVCNKVYFVISGTARSYYTDHSGNTITWSFHFNNETSISKNLFALDYRGFLTGRPSSIAIETLSELSVLIFTRESVNSLIQQSSKYERWMRKLNESAYLHMYDRAFTLLTMSATERYHKLLNEESHLMQMFSNHYIASYLGIAPQSLSRIRTQH
jgi:CRP-like cAMP-binding protein